MSSISSNDYFSKSDINPKRLGITYHPAKIGYEYYLKNKNKNYLLEINIEENIKKSQPADEISKKIFSTYSDILDKDIIKENQILFLINKIISYYSNTKSSKESSTQKNKMMMDKYPKQKMTMNLNLPSEINSNETEFYSKSNQNFFNSNGNTEYKAKFHEIDFKSEIEEINNRKSRYLDEEKEDFVNQIKTTNSNDNFISIKDDGGESNLNNRLNRYLDT